MTVIARLTEDAFLDPQCLRVYRSQRDILCLELGSDVHEEINVRRAFPLDMECRVREVGEFNNHYLRRSHQSANHRRKRCDKGETAVRQGAAVSRRRSADSVLGDCRVSQSDTIRNAASAAPPALERAWVKKGARAPDAAAGAHFAW